MNGETKEVVLIVDDNPVSVNYVETVLMEAGYEVAVATSGERALDRVLMLSPDLILLDIMMPGIGGYETCRRLKERVSTRSIPVIFLSALTETFDKVKGFNLGAVDYLMKPVESEELLARVQTHLMIRRLEKNLEHQNSLLLHEIAEKEKAEEALRKVNEELENRVMERTADLEATNEELLREMEIRRNAEDALRNSLQILEAIINSITVRVFWKDKDSVYLGCNRFFAQDAGFTEPGDIIGKDDYLMGWRDRADLYRSDDKAVILSGIPKLLYEEEQTTPTGKTIHLLTSKVPLRDADEEIIGVLGTYLNITEMKLAEAEIRHLASYPQLTSVNIMEVSPDGETIFINPAMLSTLEFLKIDSPLSFIPDDIRDMIHTWDTTTRITCEREICLAGFTFHHSILFTPEFKSVRIYSTDISRRKEVEQALVLSEEKYRTLVENIHVGVYQDTIEENGRLLWANQAMVTLFGYESLEEFLLIPVLDLYVRPDDRKKYLKVLLADGSVKDYQIKMRKKDGTAIWISTTSRVRYDHDCSLQWIDGIIEDITACYQVEELKWKAFNQINKNIEQFSILNDQIRNPLSIILLAIYENNNPYCEMIENQVRIIDDIINKLDKGLLESEKVSEFLRKHHSGSGFL